MLTENQTEAALCIWEYCLECKSKGDDTVFEWLRSNQGAATARQQCIALAKGCDDSYQLAQTLGYDDSFDWDFVPAWVDEAMSITETQDLNEHWIQYIGLKLYRDFAQA